MADDAPLRVTVAYSPGAREVFEREVGLPSGSTVAQAVHASGVLTTYPGLDVTQSAVGIWGRAAAPGQALRDLDRVEIYRPLLVDPKVARRERFGRQGARATGLFSKRRPGAKPGY
jgi:putative ubiquitin-RnfH superfamily antitoxin RatB of RatAB toxin-antitoxin module